MRELTVPAIVDLAPDADLTDAVFDNAAAHPDHIAFSRKVGGTWEPLTAKDFAAQVKEIAAGLVAKGVQPGDRVGLMSRTRFEWTLCDYAIWTAGAVTVPVYETSSAEQVAWILGDSGAVAVFVESEQHASIVDSVRDQLPDVREVVCFDRGGVDELAAGGRDVPDAELEARRAALTHDSLATIIYTSGTTGRPKGCELTHGALLFDALSSMRNLGPAFEGGTTLLFLPLAHVFARIIQCACVAQRIRIGHSPDIKNLLPDLASFQPTFILSVPRVFEKVYNSARQRAHAEGKGRIFDLAEQVAIAHSESLDRAGGLVGTLKGLPTTFAHGLFDRLVYGKLRAALGGQARFAVSGGAPLGVRLSHFFRGVGVTILEGYGLTETAPVVACNTPSALKIGTVGRPMPGETVRIAEDGEILVKGPNLFRGYWHNEAATAEVMDGEGFFHTGDLGALDGKGFLAITGRKKELLVTAGGKNVAPAVLEDRLRAHALVSQCIVVGDNKPFIGCLVTIDPEAFPAWKAQHGKPAGATVGDLREDPDLRAEIQTAVGDANKAVSKAEAIRKFVILPTDFTEEGGELTPTLKLKRTVVMKRHEAAVETLYA